MYQLRIPTLMCMCFLCNKVLNKVLNKGVNEMGSKHKIVLLYLLLVVVLGIFVMLCKIDADLPPLYSNQVSGITGVEVFNG